MEKSRDLNASDMEACRICLATDVKLHSLQDTHLGTCMESIAGFTKTCEGLPNYVCYQCAPILLKCGKLIEKSKTAQSTLLDIFDKNGQLTKTLLKEQNRSQLKLASSLDNYLLLNYDFIYFKNDDNASESIQTESIPDMKIETVKPETDCIKCDIDDTSKLIPVSVSDMKIKTVKPVTGDEKVETDKAELDKSVEEIKLETPVIEVSDDEDFISLVPHRLKGKLETCTKGISSKYQRSKRPKQALKRKRRENTESDIWSEFIDIQRDFTVSKIPFNEQLTIWRHGVVMKCVQTGSELLCRVCQKSFSNADSLQAHAYFHNPSIHGNLKCGVCLICFSTNEALDHHTEIIHANRFSCKSCPMGFNNLEDAKSHKNLCMGSIAPCIRSAVRARGPMALPLPPPNLNLRPRMGNQQNW